MERGPRTRRDWYDRRVRRAKAVVGLRKQETATSLSKIPNGGPRLLFVYWTSLGWGGACKLSKLFRLDKEHFHLKIFFLCR